MKDFKSLDEKFKAEQKHNYDVRHRVRPLPTLPDNLPVWVNNQGNQVPGEIIQQASSPRSYLVETPNGQVRRNHSQIRVRSENTPDDSNGPNNLPGHLDTPRVIATRSHTGTAIRPPDRFSQST